MLPGYATSLLRKRWGLKDLGVTFLPYLVVATVISSNVAAAQEQ